VSDSAEGLVLDVVDREPTPLEAAMLADTVHELFRGLEDRDHAAVSLLLQGYTAGEIAITLSRSERTVRRVRGRLRERLKQLYGA
jgi:RNA polymerase sigma-70 factor (ECF subfamily)